MAAKTKSPKDLPEYFTLIVPLAALALVCLLIAGRGAYQAYSHPSPTTSVTPPVPEVSALKLSETAVSNYQNTDKSKVHNIVVIAENTDRNYSALMVMLNITITDSSGASVTNDAIKRAVPTVIYRNSAGRIVAATDQGLVMT